MLFPLSKSFSSTHIFQTGEHSEAVPHRTWSIDHTGEEERTAEIRELIIQKRPYSAQLGLAKRRADERREHDAAVNRAWKNHLTHVQEMVDEAADCERQKLQERIQQFKSRRADSDAELTRRLQEQQDEYSSWKRDMQERVNSMPTMWACPPPREHPDRTKRRSEGKHAVMEHTKEYFKLQDEIKEKLQKRPSSAPIIRGQSNATVVEQKKASGLLALSEQFRDYESNLEDLYSTHHERIVRNIRASEAWNAEHKENKAAQRAVVREKFASTLQNSRQEAAELRETIRRRPKSYGGYQPVEKSKQRLRREAALMQLQGSTRPCTR